MKDSVIRSAAWTVNVMTERLVMPAIRSAFLVTFLCQAQAADAAPYAYVGDAGSTLWVIDLQIMAVKTTIPVGSLPMGIAVNAVGSRVYVANVNSGTVSVIDAHTDTVIAMSLPQFHGHPESHEDAVGGVHEEAGGEEEAGVLG